MCRELGSVSTRSHPRVHLRADHPGPRCVTPAQEDYVPLPRRSSHRAGPARPFPTVLSRLSGVGAALMLLAGAVIGLAPAASAADTTTLLDGVTSVRDLAVGGGHVFVAANDRIVV